MHPWERETTYWSFRAAERLGSAFIEQVTRGDGPGRCKPVESAARLVGAGLLNFPAASDPASVFEPVKYAIDGGPGSLRGFQDRPTVQLGVVFECLEKDFQDIEKRACDTDRSCHDAYLT